MIKGYYFYFSPLLTRDDFLRVMEETYPNAISFTWLNAHHVFLHAQDTLEERLESTIQSLNESMNAKISCLITYDDHPSGRMASERCQQLHQYQVVTIGYLLLQRVHAQDHLFLVQIKHEFATIPWTLRLTARAFLKHNLNVSRAAQSMFLHRNTFQYRLKKFYEYTSMNLRDISIAFYFKLGDQLT